MNMRLFIPDEPEGDPLLFEAAKYGDIERVRERLIAEMESVDFSDAGKCTSQSTSACATEAG